MRIESTKRLKVIGEVVLLLLYVDGDFYFPAVFLLIFSSKDVVVVVVLVAALFLKQEGISRRLLTRCVTARVIAFLSESTIILTWTLFIG